MAKQYYHYGSARGRIQPLILSGLRNSDCSMRRVHVSYQYNQALPTTRNDGKYEALPKLFDRISGKKLPQPVEYEP
jgi:hypothetical protein